MASPASSLRSLPFGPAAPAAASEGDELAAAARSFERLDESLDAPGLRLLNGHPGAVRAGFDHVERRLVLLRRRPVRIRSVDPVRVLAWLSKSPAGDPESVARALTDRLGERAWLFETERPVALTDYAARLLEALQQSLVRSKALVCIGPVASERAFGLEERLSQGARKRFVEAWAQASTEAGSEDLSELARSLRGEAALHEGDSALERHLRRLDRPVTRAELALLDAQLEAGLLLSEGRIAYDERLDVAWIPSAGREPFATDVNERGDAALADHLAAQENPFDLMHAAELWSGSNADRASRAAAAAYRACRTASLRRHFAVRLSRVARKLADVGALRREIAEIALARGDADQCLEWLRGTSTDQLDVRLLWARAHAGRGDFAAAKGVLERALTQAADDERGRILAELADIAASEGKRELATDLAAQAQRQTLNVAARLLARNAEGKAMLAKGSFAEAEAHFAADEAEAALAEAHPEELRARLNRAIAQMSQGRHAEAELLLSAVTVAAEEQDDAVARAMALANMATLAQLRRDYGKAFEVYERAIGAFQAVGDRPRLARLMVNVADLRLRVGLASQAEQGLSFARRTCGTNLPGPQRVLFSMTAARVHLAKGRSHQAQLEIEAALAQVELSQNGKKRGQLWRLAARIALFDGDLRRAESALRQARDGSTDADGAAEHALLEAEYARSRGTPYAALAAIAEEKARGAKDRELLLSTLILRSRAALAEDDPEEAATLAAEARRVRDELARSMPETMRAAFLDRPELDLTALDEADVPTDDAVPASKSPAPSTRPRPVDTPRRIVGAGRRMTQLLETVGKVAASDVTVLVRGESGTGKELIAEAVHASSPRASGALVKVNCASLVETLLMSELFGHEKGSFTGAQARRRGRFEEADGGTLFLDEIGDITPKTQVALLRVLQDQSFYRVGGSRTVRVDVRVVCATHRDLWDLVKRGDFREDLYYRLSGVTVHVPSLRERLEDLPDLSRDIIDRVAREQRLPKRDITDGALAALAEHPWRGNVRELENVLRAGCLLAEDGIDEDWVRGHLGHAPTERPDVAPSSAPLSTLDQAYQEVRGGTSLPDLRKQLEHGCIRRALEESSGNVTKAAQALGMKRPRLSQLIHQHGLKGGESDR